MRSIIIITIAIGTIAICTRTSNAGHHNETAFSKPHEELINTEISVYKSLISYLKNKYKNDKFVLLHKTHNESISYQPNEDNTSDTELYSQNIPSLRIATIRDFIAKNQQSHTIETSRLDSIYTITPENLEILQAEKKRNNSQFNTTRGTNIEFYSFSRIGFDENKTQALVAIYHHRRASPNNGRLVILNKSHSAYVVSEDYLLFCKLSRD